LVEDLNNKKSNNSLTFARKMMDVRKEHSLKPKCTSCFKCPGISIDWSCEHFSKK
jgi:hypothetical protein